MTELEKSGILIFEEDTARLAQYAGTLADLGDPVLSAASVAEALPHFERGDVAVVLMTQSPLSASGAEFVEQMRNLPAAIAVPVIFLGSAPDSLPLDDPRIGLVDWIDVPVQPERLRARVRIFVDLHRKTRQLAHLNSDIEQRVERGMRARADKAEELRVRAELLEMATEGIVVRSFKNGAIQYWNAGAEQLYGWTRDQVAGRDIHELLQTVFAESRAQVEHTLIATGSWHGKIAQHTRDGREIVVDCRKTLSRERDAVLEVCRDVTLEIKSEEALRESEKLAAMGRIAGMIAHEINNPLSAITNLFYLLQIHPSLDEQARGYAAAIEKELERVSQITRQTLGFYRESRQPVSIELQSLLDDVLELQKPALQIRGIAVQKRYDPASPVLGFPVELRQVFLNLVANAIQAMSAGGTLRLRIHNAVDIATGLRGPVVSVIDTGSGIRKEDLKHLFQPFFSTKAAKGTGLGLWISKGILEKYRGHIRYRSYRLAGKAFTCFRVFIPGSGAQSTPTPAESATKDASLPGAGSGSASLSAACTG